MARYYNVRVKRKLLLTCAAAGAIASLLAIRGLASPQADLDPLKVAPDTHKLLYENRFVRVIDAKVPVGSKEPKHNHPHGITVYMADYEVEQKSFPDGKTSRSQRKFGTVTWSEPVIHEVTNTGKTKTHSIRIELK